MNSIQIIAFTHRQFKFDEIGVFHLEDENRIHHLSKLKEILEVSELMYLSTCNRVEFVLYDDNELNNQHINKDISRNAPCPCGSGKKYKRCCGRL